MLKAGIHLPRAWGLVIRSEQIRVVLQDLADKAGIRAGTGGLYCRLIGLLQGYHISRNIANPLSADLSRDVFAGGRLGHIHSSRKTHNAYGADVHSTISFGKKESFG